MGEANRTSFFTGWSIVKLINYTQWVVVGKLLEKLIGDEITKHLEKYEVIKTSQHGFLKGKSCLLNLFFKDKIESRNT